MSDTNYPVRLSQPIPSAGFSIWFMMAIKSARIQTATSVPKKIFHAHYPFGTCMLFTGIGFFVFEIPDFDTKYAGVGIL